MQFIDFKKEHFSYNDEAENYFLEISKEEVGYGKLTIKQKNKDESLTDIDFEIDDSLDTVKIIMSKPEDIRVNF